MRSGTSWTVQGASLPARKELPPGMRIESLPVLGTTWYERGASYWVARLLMFIMMAIAVAVGSAFVAGFLSGIKDSSQTGFVVVLVIEIVWSLVIITYLMTRTFRRWNSLEPPPKPLSRRLRRVVAAGGTLGGLAQAGFALGQFVLVYGSFLFFGLYVTLLLYALLPVYPAEHKARLRMVEQLATYKQVHRLP
ncbi:MAG TPA: hypothetical protein VFI65_00845 [Streptosporangiaceae bacterium]|nr:hypothetical protein [Streptosporangiaceae bacterium]